MSMIAASQAWLRWTGTQLPFHACKRIVQCRHEDAAHDIHHKHPGSVVRLEQARPHTGSTGRIVGWAQEPAIALDKHEGFALVPGVIAECHHVCTGIQQSVKNRFRNAEPAGGVLSIDDNEVGFQGNFQARQLLIYFFARRTAYNVAQE